MKDLSKLEKSLMGLLTGLNLVVAIVLAPFIALAISIEMALRWMHKRAA